MTEALSDGVGRLWELKALAPFLALPSAKLDNKINSIWQDNSYIYMPEFIKPELWAQDILHLGKAAFVKET